MYRVLVKESAIKSNEAVAEFVDERGDVIKFQSRNDAEARAERLSSSGDRVRIQKAAPQEPANVDGYLIHFPERNTKAPKNSDRAGFTFDVGANQYGELGEALIYGSYGLSPGVKYYFYNEVETIERDTHRVWRIENPYLPEEIESVVSWSPDCLINVASRHDGEIVDQYFCEIKTGNASFERNQARDMKAVARTHGVLKIRVIIDQLPDEYTIRITEVSPE